MPIGISIGEVIEAAGGATVDDFSVLLGGVMMAKPAAGLDVPVTKTTGGIVVLPSSHSLIQRHNAKWPVIARVGRSACDQCRFCTEFCPRYLLGHPIQPHRAMQSLGFAPARQRSSPARCIAASAIYAACMPAPRISIPRTYAPNPSPQRAPTDSSSLELRNR